MLRLSILTVLSITISCGISASNGYTICENKMACNVCIQTKGCAWCTQPDLRESSRCFEATSNSMCPEEFTWNPKNRKMSTMGNDKFTHQLRPQKMSLNLRKDQGLTIEFSYTQMANYPLDLYFLMDLSRSMKDHKDNLSKLSNELVERMRKITSDLRIGFGSFNDKPVLPFTDPIHVSEPENDEVPTYEFRHHMSLDTNTTSFINKVNSSKMTVNTDMPEGTLDGLLQAIVCTKEIGWRDKARRVIVLSTDESFHVAGDGRLGGLASPNDGKCHLDEDGYYNWSKLQDYPSIGQINYVAQQNNVHIIFAVLKYMLNLYTQLTKMIEGSSAGELSLNSTNVVNLVEKEYKKISTTIKMIDNATHDIEVSYNSKCKTYYAPTNKCQNIKVGNTMKVRAHFLLKSCPDEPSEWHQVIQIRPVGINEQLTIDVNLLCGCPCESEDDETYKKNATMCNHHGDLKCGQCICDLDHFGDKCECAENNLDTSHSDEQCRQNGTDVDCNGRGECTCGMCSCSTRKNPDELFSGKYCQCDNFSCERKEGLLCSGPDHGTCECGACVCKTGWTDTACGCQQYNDTCIESVGGELCSGHGICECGACKCESTDEGRYSGKYCEHSPTSSYRCGPLKDCVQCKADQRENCPCNGTQVAIIVVANLSPVNEENGEYLCVSYDDDECKYSFKYRQDEEQFIVEALNERQCPPKVFTLTIVLSVIIATILIGLATLAFWKILVTIQDRREFARFEEDRLRAQWDAGQNPLYQQATEVFRNPTFGRDSLYAN